MDIYKVSSMVFYINEEISERCGETESLVHLHSNGDAIIVFFCGIQIWNSHDDERKHIDTGTDDGYEDLNLFLLRQISKISHRISKILKGGQNGLDRKKREGV